MAKAVLLLSIPSFISYSPFHSTFLPTLIAAASVNMLDPHFHHFTLSLLPFLRSWKNWFADSPYYSPLQRFIAVVSVRRAFTVTNGLNPSSLYFFVIGAGYWVMSLVFLVLANQILDAWRMFSDCLWAVKGHPTNSVFLFLIMVL